MVFSIHGREISNGHFSEDNQKRLNRPSSTDVPVFEAKMSRDLRLVVSLSYCDVSHRLLTFSLVYGRLRCCQLPTYLGLLSESLTLY